MSKRKFKEIQEEEILMAIKANTTLNSILNALDCHTNTYNRNLLKEFMMIHKLSGISLKKFMTKNNYKYSPKYCKFCGKELPYEKRFNEFCDHSCAASFNNQSRPHNGSKESYCLNCGQIVASGRQFCSTSCLQEYTYKTYINDWKQGLENGLKGKYEVSNYIRRYLFEKYNSSCQICGWNKINSFTGKVPLQIHHIDGDCTNNKEENLQLLCPNCHSLTENYGSRNKNATRIDERKRY